MVGTTSVVGQKLDFHIDHLDPLGQGVYKNDNKINFIAKTLPGESGVAKVLKSKKGVAFATIEELAVTASNRIDVNCPHYAKCPGCDYLHTDYQSEISYKQSALNKLLYQFMGVEQSIEVIKAPRRMAYRNRVQLHYKNSEIGFIDGLNDSLVEIPQCKILCDELQPALKALYEDKTWTESHRGVGHCELYLNKGEVNQSWNKPYASGGFSQVFDEMNQALRESVARYFPIDGVFSLLDLFSGDGNLSNFVAAEKQVNRVMVDCLPLNTGNKHLEKQFFCIDLFAEGALKSFQRQCKIKNFDMLLVDPPRKGFSGLNDWVKKIRPEYLIYVSCNPATLARDLGNLDGNTVLDHLMLLDLFPGTHHFETVAFVSLK